jgi:predicted AAA+ superfamily ATPase
MIKREKHIKKIQDLLKTNKVVGIIGARQVGKTTLAKALIKRQKSPVFFFDLENPEDLAQLQDPMFALKDKKGLVVIDEIQRKPNIFNILRVLVDRQKTPARFLILGSASPSLLQQSSQSLAGRIIYYQLSGLSIEEVGKNFFNKLWLRGGFPRSFLTKKISDSIIWRRGFIQTFLEKDLPQFGITIRSATLHRFWKMLAHYHGQIWNASEFGRSFGVADTTVRNYLDILSSALVVRQLLPFQANIAKRQVKSPKIYIIDSGLAHTLLNINTMPDLKSHPKVGASWEGIIINEIITLTESFPDECFYWATHSGAELDLLIVRGRNKIGYEIKLTTSPKVTPSMRSALVNLNLKQLKVIHAGDKSYSLAPKIEAISYKDLASKIHPIKQTCPIK